MNTIIEFFKDLLVKSYGGNTVSQYGISIIIFLVILIVVLIFHRVLLKRLKKLAEDSESPLDDFLVGLIEKNLFPLLYFGALFLATRNLELSETVSKVLNYAAITLVVLFVIRFGTSVVKYWLMNHWVKKEKNKKHASSIKGLMPAINVVIWAVGLLFLMQNLGFKVSAIAAGLGVASLAVGMAAQAILGDLFSYFSILFDRPFELGDFIILGDYMGTVEHIGLKTTRIRSLGGEQIILSNTDLTGSRVRNYKRMKTRRIVFNFGVTYNTSAKKLREIPDIVKEIGSKFEEIKVDRVHFSNFGDSALNFEAVYILKTGDYNIYMDIQQKINYQLFEEFAKQKIEFAYPTQTVFVKK